MSSVDSVQEELQSKPLFSRDDVIYFVGLIAVTIAATILGFRLYLKEFPDSENYLLLVSYFRGEIPITEIVAPFSYRPLLPLIVSFLPFDPVISFYAINAILMVVLSFTLYLIGQQFQSSKLASFITSSLCMFSHPAVAYGVAVLVDTAGIMCMALIALVMLRNQGRNRELIIFLLLVIGVTFKETVIVMAVAYLFYTKDIKRFIPMIAIPSVIYILNRILFNPGGADSGFLWVFDFDNFIVRGLNTASMFVVGFQTVMLFVIMGLILLLRSPKSDKGEKRWLWTTGIPLLGITFIGLFFAYFTSRFIWPLYIAMVPVACYGVEFIIEQVMTFKRKNLKKDPTEKPIEKPD